MRVWVEVRKTLFLVVVAELESGGMAGCLQNHDQWLGSTVLVMDPEWAALWVVFSPLVHSRLLCQAFRDAGYIPFLLRFTRDMLPICNHEPRLVHHELGRNLFFP